MVSKVYWTRRARADLRGIRDHIAQDAPDAARSFVQAIIDSTDRLQKFPLSGQVVPELDRTEIREVLRGSYRVIYRVQRDRVEILTVYHGARVLDEGF
ncbi:MAG: type II toxin-antitoxin system RelE/ParE family toxin [Pirellulaceae bacterium]